MAHALEVENGEVAFALRGAPAWHGLANRTFSADEHVSTADMLSAAKLADWNVRLEDVQYPAGYRSKSDLFMVVRTNPFDQGTDVLSVVGKRYRVFQNEELFTFGDNILDGGASWESAGSIKDGKVVFGSLVVPREFILDPQGANDKTTTYLLVHTSHDGSASVQASITPVRVVCQNTLHVALNNTKSSFKLRHTLKVEGRVAEARTALGLTFKYMDEFESIAKSLFETSMTNAQWDKLVNAIYPMPDANQVAPQVMTKWQAKRDLLDDIYHQSPTQTNIKGNYWGALNALTERIDYFRSGRTANGEALIGAASGFDPVVNAEKSRIMRAVRELASA
jgi:phage/plasmid-like protein (TIGR03299 family)